MNDWRGSGLDGVYFDDVNGRAGTVYPLGTPQSPVNNLADALTIMTANRLDKLYLAGTGVHALTLTTGFNSKIVGNYAYTITVNAGAAVYVSSDLDCLELVNTTGQIGIAGNLRSAFRVGTTTGGIAVEGHCFVDGVIQCTGALGTIAVSGNLQANGIVNSNTGSITVNGKAVTLTVTNSNGGDCTFNGGLRCFGGCDNTGGDDLAGIGELFVGGTFSNTQGELIWWGNAKIAGDMQTTSGNITIHGKAHISGLVSSTSGDIVIYGHAYIQGNITLTLAGSSLVVYGGGFVGGNITTAAGNAVTFIGNTQINGTVDSTARVNWKGVYPEVAVNTTATNAAETSFLDVAGVITGQHWTVDKVRLKCADPGANTVTVRLYELINGALTEVDSFAITAANYGNYFSLVDMFGVDHLTGDDLQITVRASAGGPYAVTGSYCWRTEGVV
jgi:hypothetical protein